MELGDSFFGLRNFVKGRITKYELEGIDPMIDRIQENHQNRAQSILVLRPKNVDEFCNLLSLSDDDTYFYSNITSPYSNYELYDSYQVNQDFKEGYGIWYEFDDESKEKLEQIARRFFGIELDWNDEKILGDFASELDDHFSRNVSNIIDDYAIEKNREFNIVAEKHVQSEIENYVSVYGLELFGEGFKTSVADLISLYLQFGIPHVSIKELLQKVFENSRQEIGGWDEDRYEYQDENEFDRASFNRTVELELEKIMDGLEEKYESNTLKDYLDTVKEVSKKFKVDKWYDLPKDEQILFRVRGFDVDSNMIKVQLKKKKGIANLKDIKVSKDGFYKLLYQPELFRLEF